MPASPTTVGAYLAALPADRRELVEAVLDTIRKNADPKFEEGIQYRMPAFFLPHSEYPDGYHCDSKQPLPFASVASGKAAVSIHLFGCYCAPDEIERLRTAWTKTGMRLDMGKACIRVKKLEQVPLDVIGAAVKRMTAAKFVKAYEQSFHPTKRKPAKKATKRAAKPVKKPAKKTAAKTAKKSAKKATK